jgi:hypothetical protein
MAHGCHEGVRSGPLVARSDRTGFERHRLIWVVGGVIENAYQMRR